MLDRDLAAKDLSVLTGRATHSQTDREEEGEGQRVCERVCVGRGGGDKEIPTPLPVYARAHGSTATQPVHVGMQASDRVRAHGRSNPLETCAHTRRSARKAPTLQRGKKEKHKHLSAAARAYTHPRLLMPNTHSHPHTQACLQVSIAHPADSALSSTRISRSILPCLPCLLWRQR